MSMYRKREKYTTLENITVSNVQLTSSPTDTKKYTVRIIDALYINTSETTLERTVKNGDGSIGQTGDQAVPRGLVSEEIDAHPAVVTDIGLGDEHSVGGLACAT